MWGTEHRFHATYLKCQEVKTNHKKDEITKTHYHTIGRYPDCVIVGAMKCGTGALRDFLITHPNLLMARNEIHFFDKHLNKVCACIKGVWHKGGRGNVKIFLAGLAMVSERLGTQDDKAEA